MPHPVTIAELEQTNRGLMGLYHEERKARLAAEEVKTALLVRAADDRYTIAHQAATILDLQARCVHLCERVAELRACRGSRLGRWFRARLVGFRAERLDNKETPT